MGRRLVLVLAILVGTLMTPSLSRAATTEVSGYAKSYVVIQDEPNIEGLALDSLAQSQNSTRLMWEHFGDQSVWQIHYELGATLSSDDANFPNAFQANANAWRLTDLPTNINDKPRALLTQNLDRFNVQLNFKAGDLTIGRQPITFGMARVINPTDVFLPFDVRTLNTEYRIGIDAIRFQKPFGPLGELDFGVIVGEDADPDLSAAFFQMRTNKNGTDYQVAVSRFAGATLLGAGLQTALGEFGFWVEAAVVSGDDDFTRVSTGVDYAFTEDVFTMIEYHYNGAGASVPEDYLTNLGNPAYQSGAVFLLGKHYLIPAVSVQLSPLLGLSLQSIFNIDDQSAFLSMGLEYNVATDFYMDFGFYHFIGDEITSPPLTLHSEYGGNPDTIYASLRYYF